MSHDSPTPTPLRRFRFGLRSLFVVVTLIACWLGFQLNWIRQRHGAIERGAIEDLKNSFAAEPRAPGGLWIFGERGISDIAVDSRNKTELPALRRLFPEAKVCIKETITFATGVPGEMRESTIYYNATEPSP